MRSPSGAEDIGSEDVGVTVSVAEGVVVAEGLDNAVEVELIAVRVGTGVVTASVGIEITLPQAPTSDVMRIIENRINTHLSVFI
jgi:hypothetical protein